LVIRGIQQRTPAEDKTPLLAPWVTKKSNWGEVLEAESKEDPRFQMKL
jgi:hypothetical protein